MRNALRVAWCNVEFAAAAAGIERTVAIFDVASNRFIALDERTPINGDTTNVALSSGPWYATQPTSLQVYVYQDSGAALNINYDPGNSAEFAIYQIG